MFSSGAWGSIVIFHYIMVALSLLRFICNTLDEPDLHVAVACGPFTTNTSQDIAPLLALLKSVKEHRPHVLILLGPLVDSLHPLAEVSSPLPMWPQVGVFLIAVFVRD